jgi:hypothetical protein
VQVRGVHNLTTDEIRAELRAGGRLVFFETCVSLLFVSRRWASDLYLLRTGERGLWRGLPYSLLTLFLGWWGLPWGLVSTPQVLLVNLGGGHDVTAEASSLFHDAVVR